MRSKNVFRAAKWVGHSCPTSPDKCEQYQASIPNQQTIATPNSFQAA
uniref:Uncharacterized protein n=1 Tax=Myoviridae sp. ctLYR7 TaxID=2827679 RepID=A0A8S5RX81_9CAUD|nr:MAG TPA: hypothetical protein [Myoviridae sp. ctLYR7]